jgi:hypothetical protein
VTQTAEPAVDYPAEFAGTLGIEWPAGDLAAGKALHGWKITPYDAEGPVTTVSEIALHASVLGLIWADLTMFTDKDGRPVLHLPDHQAPHLGGDGRPTEATFPYLITSMRVR